MTADRTPRPAGGDNLRPGAARPAGSLTLEFALIAPLVFLAVLVVLHAGLYASDALLAQQAAGRGARVAAATTGRGPVAAAVHDAADGRSATAEVSPVSRRTGQVVTVTVRLESPAGPGTSQITASASAEVEPGVGQ